MQDALYNSWHRILYTVANSNAMNGFNDSSEMVRVYPWWEITLISSTAVTSIAAIVLLGFMVFFTVPKKKLRKEV